MTTVRKILVISSNKRWHPKVLISLVFPTFDDSPTTPIKLGLENQGPSRVNTILCVTWKTAVGGRNYWICNESLRVTLSKHHCDISKRATSERCLLRCQSDIYVAKAYWSIPWCLSSTLAMWRDRPDLTLETCSPAAGLRSCSTATSLIAQLHMEKGSAALEMCSQAVVCVCEIELTFKIQVKQMLTNKGQDSSQNIFGNENSDC